MKISVIVSTYNNPKYLTLCLKSIMNQSLIPDEIIIADDGSGPETLCNIELFQKVYPLIVVRHVWQEDEGFRLAQILNKAIATAIGDYIVQINGDLILHKHYIKDHISVAKKSCFVIANRINLSHRYSKELSNNFRIDINFRHIIHDLHLAFRFSFLSKIIAINKYANTDSVLVGNASFWKSDCININGYNNDIFGNIHADEDFFRRMIFSGVKRIHLKFAGISYHLYHDKYETKDLEVQRELLDDLLDNEEYQTDNGLTQLNV